MLGIGRKTGSKWRNGYAARDPKTGVVRHYAPIVQVRHEAPISPRFLSEDERVRIADLRKADLSPPFRAVVMRVEGSDRWTSRAFRTLWG
jgi:transposase, IS30 family